MTLLEAIKTGKRFKRPGYIRWHNRATLAATGDFPVLSLESATADDWEVEPQSITITMADVKRAWDAAKMVPPYILPFPILCHELGFKE